MPGAFNAQTITQMPQKSIVASAQTRDVVTGFIDALLSSRALAAHSDDHGATGPVLHDPRWCGPAPECPGDVAAMTAFTLACLVGDLRM